MLGPRRKHSASTLRRGLALALGSACAALALAGCAREPAGPPNIVVILTDDQGWGATSVAMDPDVPESGSDFVRTPRLERLAAAGLRFSRAYATHPNCSPSRASLLTGRSPAALGFTDVPRPPHKFEPFYRGNRLLPPQGTRELSRELDTIPELLAAAHPEYRSAHFGKWHLGAGGPVAHGFDEGDGATGNEEGDEGERIDPDPKRCFSVTRRAIDFLRRRERDGRPFYLQVSHYAPHLAPQSRRSSLARVQRWPAGERHADVDFASMSLDLDAAVGQLLEALDELSPPERTWVFYTSDNGTYPTADPANVNGPLRGGKSSLWEGGVRVPWIVRGPGVAAGAVSGVPAVGFDLLPTVAELAGVGELPEGVEGVSLLPVLLGEASVLRRPGGGVGFHFPHYQHRKGTRPATTWLDLESGSKVHQWWEDGRVELYDLETDPGERRDLASSAPARAAELVRSLEAWLERVGAPRPTPNPDYDPARDPAARFPPESLTPYD